MLIIFMLSMWRNKKDRRKVINTEIIPLIRCTRDVSGYLRTLEASASGKKAVTEVKLMINRAGLLICTREEIDKITVCPRDRDYLTTNWPGGKAVRCCYPFHEEKNPRRGGSSRFIRRVNIGNFRKKYFGIGDRKFVCIFAFCYVGHTRNYSSVPNKLGDRKKTGGKGEGGEENI